MKINGFKRFKGGLFINSKKQLLIVCMILVLLMGVGSSFAIDVNKTNLQANDDTDMLVSNSETDIVSSINTYETNTNADINDVGNGKYANNDSDSNILGVTDKNSVIGQSSESVLKDAESEGTFTDLVKLIKVNYGNTLTLDKNYTYNATVDSEYNANGIVIDRAITIDGNGFFIKKTTNTRIITVNGNDVIIKNVNLPSTSTILWTGANGKLLDSTLTNPSITWQGDDGESRNNQFLNNNRNAFYIQYALNLLITDCNFTNFNIKDGTRLVHPVQSSSNSIIKRCNFNGISGGNAVYNCIIAGYGQGEIQECNFTISYSGNTGSIIFISTPGWVINKCNFYSGTGNGGVIECEALGTHITNCNFENTYKMCVGGYNLRGGTAFENCTFNNARAQLFEFKWDGVSFNNCNFTNIASFGNLNNKLYINLNNCVFTNANPGSSSAVIFGKTDRSIFKDLTFINTQSGSDINITNGSRCNFDGKIIESAGIVKDGVTSFTPHYELYVDNSTNGIGTKENPCNLTTAINNIYFQGRIYLASGEYNELSGRVAVLASLLGDNKDKVIINKGCFETPITNIQINNITFKNTATSFLIGQVSTLSNCKFVDLNIASTNLISYPGACYPHFINFYNITIEDSLVYSLQYSSNLGSNCFLDNITIINSTLTRFINNANDGYLTAKNINVIDNSVIKDSLFYKKGRMSAYNINVDHSKINSITNYCSFTGFVGDEIHIENSEVTGILFTSSQASGLTLNQVKINDCTFSSAVTSIFNLKRVDSIIANSTFKNFNVASLTTGSFRYDMNNIVVDNVAFTNQMFVASDDSTFNRLNLNKVTLSADKSISTFGKNVELENSVFNNVVGSLTINGNSNHIINTNFINCNSSVTDYGVVIVNGMHTSFRNSKFINNKASYGGAVYITKNDTNFYNVTFTNNIATVSGGAIYSPDSIYLYLDDKTTSLPTQTGSAPFKNTIYIHKLIPTYGTIYVYTDATNTASSDGLSYNTNSLDEAFALITPNGKIIFKENGESFNLALDEDFNKNGISVLGYNTLINVVKTFFVGESSEEFSLSKMIFENASDSAIVWKGGNGNIIDCVFRNNGYVESTKWADTCSYGGALVVNSDDLTITNTKFENNVVNGEGDNVGGAIYVNGSNLIIRNCDFIENNAINGGSNLYQTANSLSIFIYDSTFNNSQHSALELNGVNTLINGSNFNNNHNCLVINSIGVVNLSYSKFIGNFITGNGGVVQMNLGELIAFNSTFYNNVASGNGGAIYLSGGSANILKSIFNKNTANNGGAIYINAGTLKVNEAEFVNNIATNNGGAIYTNSGLTLADSTFNGNRAALGGAVYINGNANTLTNLEFVSNTATSDGSGVYVAGNSAVTVNGLTVNSNTHPTNKYDVYFGNNVLFSVPVTGITLGQNQRINYGSYLSNVLYVSPSGTGANTGLSEADSTTFANAMNHITTGGKIIFLSGVYSDLIKRLHFQFSKVIL